MGQEIISLWSWGPPDDKPAHIRNRTNKFEAMRSPDPLSCDMKDLRKICSSLSTLLPLRIWPLQSLSFVKSLKVETKQIQNSRAIPCSLGRVPVFSMATQNLLKFRSTFLVSFVRPRTSWHGRMMSLVLMTRSCRFRAQTAPDYP